MDTETDPMANLSPEQANTLLSFSEITQIEDMNLCRSILSQNSWNLDVSVENFINNRVGDPSSSLSPDRAQHTEAAREERGANEASDYGGPLSVLTSYLRWLFQTTPVSLSPDQDTLQFVDKFHLDYDRSGGQVLNMERTSYAQAVQKAHRESKFLLVYLHSPLHDDTSRFCSSVLCSDGVLQLVNGRGDDGTEEHKDEDLAESSAAPATGSEVVVWAGQVFDPEAFNLSMDLNATSFPFVALLMCQSDRSVRVLDRVHGFIDSHTLTDRLQQSISVARVEMDRVRNEQIVRTAEANLRVEQDREYQEAVEADRRQQREAQQRREEQEQAEREAHQRREEEAALALSSQRSREAALSKKRAVVTREAPSGGNSALVRFQLPHGVKVSHTFWKTDPVECLYDFLSVHFADHDIPIENFVISTNFPKKDLTDKSQTVDAAGLFPRGALFVHNLDS